MLLEILFWLGRLLQLKPTVDRKFTLVNDKFLGISVSQKIHAIHAVTIICNPCIFCVAEFPWNFVCGLLLDRLLTRLLCTIFFESAPFPNGQENGIFKLSVNKTA